MIASKFVDLYARNSGLRDKLVAERDVVLTYALRALADAGVLGHLAFPLALATLAWGKRKEGDRGSGLGPGLNGRGQGVVLGKSSRSCANYAAHTRFGRCGLGDGARARRQVKGLVAQGANSASSMTPARERTGLRYPLTIIVCNS